MPRKINALGEIANWQFADPSDEISSLTDHIRAHPVAGDPTQMRRAFATLIGPGPDGRRRTLGGVPCISHGSGPPVLWFHGGGYVFGSPETHARAASCLARMAGAEVILPDYRLAPEHLWPAPLEDAQHVLHSCPSPLAVVGDSAGGHLALTLALRFPSRISGLALISPNTDRSGQSRTRTAHSDRDLMNSDGDDARLAAMAMPECDPQGATASPLLADLSGLPPTFITAATNEVLLDDALLLIRALGRAEVATVADIQPGLFHLWPLWPDRLSRARATLARIAAHLAEPRGFEPR